MSFITISRKIFDFTVFKKKVMSYILLPFSTAGDHVKFNLPMAYSTWVLEWGFLRFQDAYKATGNLDKMCGMIKWPLDYFLKCWIPDQNVLYVQVIPCTHT